MALTADKIRDTYKLISKSLGGKDDSEKRIYFIVTVPLIFIVIILIIRVPY